MERRTRAWGTALAVGVLLAVTGCGSDTSAGRGDGDAKGANSPSPSASSPGSPSVGSPSALNPSSDSGSGSDGKPAAAELLPGMVSAKVARTQLAALTVAEPRSMAGYSRARFPHWAEQGAKCDTRETVLKRDGKDVRNDADCRAVSGTWVSLYDGQTITEAGKLDIDHMVPLAAAWRAGADKWDDSRRKAFANDLTNPQLLAVSAKTNRSKGDQTPDQWQPPSRDAWCVYGRAWTRVKSAYELTVTETERKTLTDMLDTCGAS
ncbi:HNH endonuclease family protein (plasmid) [Streptomyces sp. BI20]|uniref:HNH endonuclease family protein n=1 Tax=Streptomyces sp. BI20 TaxID=3403460 RepID=UPI003C787204